MMAWCSHCSLCFFIASYLYLITLVVVYAIGTLYHSHWLHATSFLIYALDVCASSLSLGLDTSWRDGLFHQ